MPSRLLQLRDFTACLCTFSAFLMSRDDRPCWMKTGRLIVSRVGKRLPQTFVLIRHTHHMALVWWDIDSILRCLIIWNHWFCAAIRPMFLVVAAPKSSWSLYHFMRQQLRDSWCCRHCSKCGECLWWGHYWNNGVQSVVNVKNKEMNKNDDYTTTMIISRHSQEKGPIVVGPHRRRRRWGPFLQAVHCSLLIEMACRHVVYSDYRADNNY